jgi:rubrerythrin
MGMIIIDRVIMAIFLAGLLAGCAATSPPTLPPNNPADPQARESNRPPGSFLMVDATTRAITDRLKQGPQVAQMPGGNMPGMQHDAAAPSKEALEEEMKKTSEEMKKTSDALKQKSDSMPAVTSYFTCPMHPEIHQDKPGKCPICGMALVKKEGKPPK